jgi:hypothetical protein
MASSKSIDLLNADRQVRAVGVAEMAGSALFGGSHNGMIAVRMHCQHLCWAEIYADLAALTPGGINADFTPQSSGYGCCGGFGRDRHFRHNDPFSIKYEIDVVAKS